MAIGSISGNFNPADIVPEVGRLGAAGSGMQQQVQGAFMQSREGRETPRADMAKTEIAQRQAQGVRRQQQEAVDMTRQAAMGEVPSVAEMQQRQGIQQALAGQLALANSAQGGAGASLMALRGAQANQAQLGAQGAQQGAMLRAQEMAAARGQLGQQLQGFRGQDQALAQQQQQAALAGQQAALQGRGMDDALTLGFGGLSQGFAGQADAQARAQASLEQQRGLGIAGLEFQREQQNAAAEQAQLGMILGGLTGGFGGLMSAGFAPKPPAGG